MCARPRARHARHARTADTRTPHRIINTAIASLPPTSPPPPTHTEKTHPQKQTTTPKTTTTQGKVVGDAFIVLDAFALPVEGTETRVNAQAEAYEYMVDFQSTTKVGWFVWFLCV